MNFEEFGNYTLLDRLGRGGMGEVYLAKQRGLQRLVAIKRRQGEMASADTALMQFADEANIAAHMNHPGIAQIYDFGDVDGQCFIAMEYIQGHTIAALFQRYQQKGRVVPMSLACHVAISLCQALDYAHNRSDGAGRPLGFVHRDISPGNLMLSFDGTVKLIDFGIAKALCRSIGTRHGAIKGTPAYLAPERLSGEADASSDVFSCGVVLFELLTGRRLFPGPRVGDVLFRLRHAQLPGPRAWNPAVPPALDAIVRKAMSRIRSQRFDSARAMCDALVAFTRRHDLAITQGRARDWMQTRYGNDYSAELQRIAALWRALDARDEHAVPLPITTELSHRATTPFQRRQLLPLPSPTTSLTWVEPTPLAPV